jgi:anaerobic selenocysteine-containing dehydrogenase
MHQDDLDRLNLKHNQPVTVCNETGELTGILARRFNEIRPGNALMYYPEANELVARHVDPGSRTPAFKGVVVNIRPM